MLSHRSTFRIYPSNGGPGDDGLDLSAVSVKYVGYPYLAQESFVNILRL